MIQIESNHQCRRCPNEHLILARTVKADSELP